MRSGSKRRTPRPSGDNNMKRQLVALICLFVVAHGTAVAQVEEIVVTGSRISGDDYSGIPAITLDKRADFLVQRIRLTNDTRATDARKKELYKTIRDLLADAANRPSISLGYGDEFLIPITADDHEIPLEGAGRPDTSATQLYVKMALGPKDDVGKSISALDEFIDNARVSGRTEIQHSGDVALSLVNPEKYRYEIIGKIAEDARQLRSALAAQCGVEIGGLANRVSWQRSDIAELTLYIPYEVRLVGCQ
jgi:hypothetical protein